MDLFRAVPESRLSDAPYLRQATTRIPGNIPYVVDNLWEWLRPEQMPSLRHAVYASPTAELALNNASAHRHADERYIACRVVVDPEVIRVAHLQVRDAREHSDIRMVSKWLSQNSRVLTEVSLVESRPFLPGLLRSELEQLRQANPWVQQCCEHLQQHSTFWQSASATQQRILRSSQHRPSDLC